MEAKETPYLPLRTTLREEELARLRQLRSSVAAPLYKDTRLSIIIT